MPSTTAVGANRPDDGSLRPPPRDLHLHMVPPEPCLARSVAGWLRIAAMQAQPETLPLILAQWRADQLRLKYLSTAQRKRRAPFQLIQRKDLRIGQRGLLQGGRHERAERSRSRQEVVTANPMARPSRHARQPGTEYSRRARQCQREALAGQLGICQDSRAAARREPVALTLERVGRQHLSRTASRHLTRAPVDRHSVGPQRGGAGQHLVQPVALAVQ